MRDRIVGERSTRCNALTNRNKNALQLSYESKIVFDIVEINVDIETAIVEENGTTDEIDMMKLLQEKLAATVRRHPTTQLTTTPATTHLQSTRPTPASRDRTTKTAKHDHATEIRIHTLTRT